ncbi:peptidoglycan-binding protein [Streptomyces sp. AC512_CC834]|uniref:peptidoglycan-binding domain-containing protein n=1 Tax=Streptomyces sp. AC512_CC834 TaxID=2823691 RepID=UPI001C281444|nr:peptidoglycan-binding domain-containing protein [Streptomyces sp. AC512_CC834]
MEQQKEPSQEQPAGASCPECGTPRAVDNTPSCACGTRASEALRDARTAQVAAAEDFDPLRIRPYVELDGAAGEPTRAADASGATSAAAAAGAGQGAEAGTPTPDAAPDPDADPEATMTLRAVDAGVGSTAAAAAGADPAIAAPGAATGEGTEADRVLPTPLAAPTGSPSTHDLRLFESSATARLPSVATGPDGVRGAGDDGERPPRRRRKGVLLSAVGAVVVVVGAAGFASGLFSYETPSRDGAMPDEVRAGVPAPSTDTASPSAEASTSSAPSSPSASPSVSVSPSPSASVGASASASPSPSASSASPTPSRSAGPTQTTTAPADDAPQESEDDDPDRDGGPTLRRGDRGSEVVELQQRLRDAEFYYGDIDGDYDRQVEESVRHYQWRWGIYSDELGVYGPDTRRRLESETPEP